MIRVPTWQTTLIPLVPNSLHPVVRRQRGCRRGERNPGASDLQRYFESSLACDRMLSVHPGNRPFEGLSLEIEKRNVKSDWNSFGFSAELERVPNLHYRIEAIQHALNRYPTNCTTLRASEACTRPTPGIFYRSCRLSTPGRNA